MGTYVVCINQRNKIISCWHGCTHRSDSALYVLQFNLQLIKTVYLKEGLDGRIRNSTFSTFAVPTASNGWESGNELTIGGSTLTGSIDEFRLWSAPLSESVISNHTLLPEAINGNHIKSSTEDLIFRLDFEYPKDRSSVGDTSIKNVSIDTTYSSFATASNFTSITQYPHQYFL